MDRSAQLFAALWACTTLEAALALLDRVPHRFTSIGHRNNKANIKTNSDSVASIVEAVTNGHDATIRLWKEQGRFSPLPTTVNEALTTIAEASGGRRAAASVYVLMHLSADFKKHHAVTIVDEGIGMDEAAMLRGPLAFGSEDKVLDPCQFGSFGQGGASLFGHSKLSIVASRRAGSNTLVYSVVWLDRTEGIHSFVYLTQPDGKLFSFDVRTLPHQPPSERLAVTLASNGIILPRQGTIRRQLQIEGIKEYWSTKDYGLYNGLQDRLFGVPAYVRLAGDDDPGHLNNRRGRQYELDAVAEGELLPNHKGAKLLKRLPPMRTEFFRGTGSIGYAHIYTWVVSSWKRKEKTKTTIATPARAMLEGPESAVSRSIFVTYNGQTLQRLPSTAIFSAAGLRAIADNIIMRVEIDQLDPILLQDAEVFLSTREGLSKWFETNVRSELLRYLKGQDELKLLALEMEPPSEPQQSTDLGLEMNKFLQDPIFGRGLGYGSQTSDSGTGPIIANSMGSSKTGKKTGDEHRKSAPQSIVLIDPPTKLEMNRRSVIRNATNYVTIHTNAFDHFGPDIKVALPPFLTMIDPGTLRNGRMTLSASCDNSPLGATGVIQVWMAGTGLEAQCEVAIVPRNEIPKQAQPDIEGIGTLGRRNEHAPPCPDVKYITGPEHPLWSQFFSMADPARAGFNYYLQTDLNVLKLGIHTGFPPLAEIQAHLSDRFGTAIGKDYLKRVSDHLILNGLCCCRNSTLSEQGAVDDSSLEILTDIARGTVVFVGSLYSNRGFRNSVLAGIKGADD